MLSLRLSSSFVAFNTVENNILCQWATVKCYVKTIRVSNYKTEIMYGYISKHSIDFFLSLDYTEHSTKTKYLI